MAAVVLVLLFIALAQGEGMLQSLLLVGTLVLRSTKVTTLDRFMIILPNFEFLESRLINWSHGSAGPSVDRPVPLARGGGEPPQPKASKDQ